MSIPFSLLRLVGKELAKHALNTAASALPVGNILVGAAETAMRGWNAQSREDQAPGGIAGHDPCAPEDVRKQVAEIIRQEFADLPPQAAAGDGGLLDEGA